MPSTWEKALLSYRWPVTFTDFKDADKYLGWFSFDLSIGDRTQTMEFESYFREHAQEHLEVWLEVVFWKLYGRAGTKTTRDVANYFHDHAIAAASLWLACEQYIKAPTKASFQSLRQHFGFKQPVIAVAATFPAFIAPASYPMVDTRIAKWVTKCMDAHNEADPKGCQLIRSRFADAKGRTVLMMDDCEFMQRWTCWCVNTANKLSNRTPRNWRARDVEMAVFTAWGRKGGPHPVLNLNPLGPL